MFDRFPRCWTPLLPLTELDANPMPAELAGERIVLFADCDGNWHALLDRCPHRGAALSRGRVTERGHLRCQYHGWRFDGAGRCTGVPLNDLNAAALEKIRVAALPTRRIAGALWIYTDVTDDPPEPVLPASLEGDAERFVTYHQQWDAHWTRAQENFIDFVHLPYLHGQSITAWMHDYAEQGGSARVEAVPKEFGFTMLGTIGGTKGLQLDWYRPNLAILHFGPAPEQRLHLFSIPIDETHTRVLTVSRIADASAGSIDARPPSGTDHPILDEDRAIVESQAGDVLSDPTEISVASDEPTLVFRRWYRELVSDPKD